MPAGASSGVLDSRLPWARIRCGLGIAYGLTLLVFVVTEGVPTERLGLYTWVLAGLSLCCVGRGWRPAVGLVRDWLPFVAVLAAYDLTRGLADGLGMPVHVSDLAAAESWLFGATLPTVWLQAHLYPTGAWGAGTAGAWWHVTVSAVYASHYFVTPITAGVLWVRDRRRWRSYAAHVLGIAVLGVATYILVPAAPPWYAAAEGVIPPVKRLSNIGWDVVGLDRAGSLLDQGQAKVNLVAAVPSLHTAYAVLALVFFWPVLRRLGRLVLTGYPLLMGFVLVYSGEHYVIDVLLGWVCVGIVVFGLRLTSYQLTGDPARCPPGPGPPTGSSRTRPNAAHPLVGDASAD